MSDEILRDCPNIVDNVSGMVGQSFGWTIDDAILYNTASLVDTSVTGSNCASTVSISNVAANLTTKNIKDFESKLAPSYKANAEWYMGLDSWAAIEDLVARSSTGGYPVLARNLDEAEKRTLLGHKVNIMEQSPALGSTGSIILADLAQQAVITKGGLLGAMSIHVQFLTVQNTYRWTIRLNTAPLIASKILLPCGLYVSPFVTAA